MENQNKQHI